MSASLFPCYENRRPRPLGTLDVVRLDGNVALQMLETMKKATRNLETSALFFKHPAVPSMTLILIDTEGTRGGNTRVDYSRRDDNTLCVYVSPDGTPLVLEAFVADLRPDPEHGTLIWVEPSVCAIGYENWSSEQELKIHEIWLTLVYVSVQFALYNRPTLFRETTARADATPSNPRRQHKKSERRRKVKTYRVITIDPGAVTSSEENKRVITCPAYGVCGHFRHYKNGKVAWVRPYTKGKLRNVAGAYSGKEYELVTEGAHGE
jgi:hypothetical protein